MFGKKSKQQIQQAEDRLREEELDKIIGNPNADINIFAENPVEINYNTGGMRKKSTSKYQSVKKLMLEVEEISPLSQKKYIINPDGGILIGSKNGINNIVIVDPDIDDIQCQILLYEGSLFIRNVGNSGNPILRRGKNTAPVSRGTIPLKDRDKLKLGNVELTFSYIFS